MIIGYCVKSMLEEEMKAIQPKNCKHKGEMI